MGKVIELSSLHDALEILWQTDSHARVVLCLGCFDLLHPGHVRHLQAAKRMGDVLVVAVTSDRYVRKGLGRPAFKQDLRVEAVAALGCVDFTFINDFPTGEEAIKTLRPGLFVKGQEFEPGKDPTGRFQKEVEAAKNIGCEMRFTHEKVFSSTRLLERYFGSYAEVTVRHLAGIGERYGADKIIEFLKSLKSLKILVVGDAIVDEYSYCEPLGKSSAGPLIVHKYLSSERFAGGALMVVNNALGLCGKARLVTMLSSDKSMENFIQSKLGPSVESMFFHRGSPTTVKTRFVDRYLNQTLFQVNRLEEEPMPTELEKRILRHLEKEIPKVDLVMVSDFGHGLVTEKIIRLLEKYSPLAVNVQTNSANVGFNTIAKYRRADFVCLNEVEARLACQDRRGKMEDILEKLARRIKTRQLIVTRGSKGCVSFDSNAGLLVAPALCGNAIDRLGAGDAFFAFAAPCFAGKLPPDLVSFVGNAAGALAAQIIGNREPVEPGRLFEFIRNLIRDFGERS